MQPGKAGSGIAGKTMPRHGGKRCATLTPPTDLMPTSIRIDPCAADESSADGLDVQVDPDRDDALRQSPQAANLPPSLQMHWVQSVVLAAPYRQLCFACFTTEFGTQPMPGADVWPFVHSWAAFRADGFARQTDNATRMVTLQPACMVMDVVPHDGSCEVLLMQILQQIKLPLPKPVRSGFSAHHKAQINVSGPPLRRARVAHDSPPGPLGPCCDGRAPGPPAITRRRWGSWP